MDLNALLRRAVDLGASDVHLKQGQPPVLRRDGELAPLEDHAPLDEAALAAVLGTVGARTPEKLQQFHATGDLDTAYQDEDLPRFRVNGYRQRGAISFAFRVIPKTVPSFSELGMPHVVQKLSEEHRGLILCTGATGSGKTTTLAAMLDHMNRTRRQHIVTIEDPIEILHDDHGSIINQREVGLDTNSFGEALRRALRQDPDVILIGEMRDEETVQTALSAAETGHLVLSTVHTVDATESINRMLDFFPPHQHQQARAMIAGTLKGVVSQRLIPSADGGGRVAVCEILVMTGRVRDMIMDPTQTGRLHEVIQEGEYYGMQTFDQALLKHVQAGRVSMEEALRAATHPHDFKLLVAAEGRRSTSMEDVVQGERGGNQPAGAPPSGSSVRA